MESLSTNAKILSLLNSLSPVNKDIITLSKIGVIQFFIFLNGHPQEDNNYCSCLLFDISKHILKFQLLLVTAVTNLIVTDVMMCDSNQCSILLLIL